MRLKNMLKNMLNIGLKKMNDHSNYQELKSKDEARKYLEEKFSNCWKQDKIKKDQMTKSTYRYGGENVSTPIELYTGYMYSDINEYMREIKQPEDEKTRIHYDALIDQIHETIYSAPRLSEDIVVYRTIDKYTFNMIMRSIKKEGKYIEKGFMSTTLLKERVMEIAKVNEADIKSEIMKIYIPKGVYVLGIDGREQEMLFPAGQSLTFIDCYKDKETNRYIKEFELCSGN